MFSLRIKEYPDICNKTNHLSHLFLTMEYVFAIRFSRLSLGEVQQLKFHASVLDKITNIEEGFLNFPLK